MHTETYAGALNFVPRLLEYSGELSVDMSYESNESTADGRGMTASDSTIMTRLSLSANGFVYHPRFIIFLAKVSAGLRDEKFETNSSSSSWQATTAHEYEFRLMVLPEHPYNLELFISKRIPLVRSLMSVDLRPVSSAYGATFKYKKRPLFFDISYVQDTVGTNIYTSEATTLNSSVSYILGPSQTTAGYSDMHSESSTGSDNGNRSLFVDNQLGLFGASLSSHVLATRLEQNESGGSFLKDSALDWTEELMVPLPWNFQTAVSFNHHDEEIATTFGPVAGSTDLSSRSDSAGLTLTHRLYQSLVSSYSLNFIRLSTTGGDFSTVSNSLNSTYTKKVPFGTMTAGLNLMQSVSERSGAPVVINERHSVRIFDEFSLGELNIDSMTVSVRVASPLTGELFLLEPGLNYTLLSIGTETRIRITALPPHVIMPDPFYFYEFHVTYSKIFEDVKLERRDLGFRLQFDLFDNLLTPRYAYSRSEQKVLSGAISGGPEESSTHSIGLAFRKGPFTASVDYQKVSSDFSPGSSLRAEVQYVRNIGTSANIAGRVFYERMTYEGGASFPEVQSISESQYGGDIKVQATIPRRKMRISFAGAYSRREGSSETTTYATTGTFVWNIGKLDLNMGYSISSSVSGSDGEDQKSSSRLFYLSLVRKLF